MRVCGQLDVVRYFELEWELKLLERQDFNIPSNLNPEDLGIGRALSATLKFLDGDDQLVDRLGSYPALHNHSACNGRAARMVLAVDRNFDRRRADAERGQDGLQGGHHCKVSGFPPA